MAYDPSTEPVEDGADPSSAFQKKMKEVLERAIISREWDYPLATAATDAAEMDHVDFAYWYYKMEKPTLKAEEGVLSRLFSNNKSFVKLPEGFERSSFLTLSASGDLMPMDGIEASQDKIYENVSDILFNFDISFANLEAPVTKYKFEGSVIEPSDPENCTILRSSFAQFDALVRHKDLGFNVLNFATNHTFDLGLEGLETTQQLLVNRKIVCLGTPKRPQDFGKATIITKAGIRVGFISATFGLNNRRLPQSEAYRIHTSRLVSKYVEPELELLKEQIRDCKAQGCDFVVASMHWGFEFEFFPRSKQIDAAHELIEHGVDLIIGHHPHVVQPVEYYRTQRDPQRIAVIAYSLGGVTYDAWDAAAHLALSFVLNMKLSKGRVVGGAERTYIESVEVIPVLQHISKQGDTRLISIEKLEEHVPVLCAQQPDDWSKRVEQCQIYADLVLGNQGAN
ncbi:CapA family protein [Labrys okinawensis]|uniref:CapA family protein n=1 Tax=Labrys okinawensis TaxID=346911 RepID=UPI0039BCAA18